VRHIGDNGENECSLTNFNMGMSTQCAWLNDRATLQGRTILYNNKKIRILKNKVTNTKHIRFYYVLSAGKPSPTVPTDQGFYQSPWDGPDRSNRSLKRTAAPSQIASAPQAKKAKTSSVSTTAEELTQSASRRPPPPKSFEEATKMVVEAWKIAFPSLRFPVKFIGLCPAAKSLLVAAPHQSDPQPPPPSTHQPTTNSSRLKVAINRNLESQLLKERAFFKALKATVARN
jgi:hypothetical protein